MGIFCRNGVYGANHHIFVIHFSRLALELKLALGQRNVHHPVKPTGGVLKNHFHVAVYNMDGFVFKTDEFQLSPLPVRGAVIVPDGAAKIVSGEGPDPVQHSLRIVLLQGK